MNPCKNGGVCIPSYENDSYSCQCKSTALKITSGKHCETVLSQCVIIPIKCLISVYDKLRILYCGFDYLRVSEKGSNPTITFVLNDI